MRFFASICLLAAVVFVAAHAQAPDTKAQDKETKKEREVDVSIRYPVGSVSILITVECRRRGRVEDCTWIEQLAGGTECMAGRIRPARPAARTRHRGGAAAVQYRLDQPDDVAPGDFRDQLVAPNRDELPADVARGHLPRPLRHGMPLDEVLGDGGEGRRLSLRLRR